jgi:hypothetical protein
MDAVLSLRPHSPAATKAIDDQRAALRLTQHEVLFAAAFTSVHDAGTDVAACACCFFEPRNRGIGCVG